MAKASKKQAESTDEPTVTRITASESGVKTKKKILPVSRPKKAGSKNANSPVRDETDAPQRTNPAKAAGGYFAGSWRELMQVRWPTRGATWSMTGALIAFTLFFVAVILLLDAGFTKLFNLLIGK